MKVVLAAALCSAWAVYAQEPAATPAVSAPKTEPAKTEAGQPPVLENHGKPMRVPFECTDDDMQWAGMSCSEEEPCPVYIEISAIEPVGNRLVVLANIHTESITLYSVLLTSEDAGATWREPYERARGVGLDHVQFIDFQNGWISGETLVPVAHDPFLLITNDGGVTWRLRPVFSEGAGGAIQQFWFESAKVGDLVLDRRETADASRYELYGTPNGGETWMIRRTSDAPIAIKRPVSDPAGSSWRIRADARTKSFAIEKKQGERWSAAASFLVQIGACKPAPRAAPAPPATEPAETAAPAAPATSKTPSLKRPPKP
ncbi:MAG TPA: hypothetical protein VNH83_30750 [Bryobacteraceae bacterium]|nr:hypothetical protein [Bryobacteraceae bacterium]